MDKSDFAGRAVLKSLGTGSGVQNTGGINERFYTPGQTSSPVYAGENKPPKCWFCHKLGHRCMADKSSPGPRTMFNKSSTQPQPAVTPKPGQAKINHASILRGLPSYLLNVQLAHPVPKI